MQYTMRVLALVALALACVAILKVSSRPRPAASGIVTADAPVDPMAMTAAAASSGMIEARPAAQTAGAADFSGDWVLDPSRSDLPPMRGGGMRGNGGNGGNGAFRRGGGDFGGRRSSGQGDSARGDRGRPGRLPPRFHLTETSNLVSFEDSTGAVIQEISTAPGAAATAPHASDVPRRTGAWKSGSLELVHDGWGGSKVVETWSLQDQGASLVAQIHFQGGDRGDRTMRRVYRRVSQ